MERSVALVVWVVLGGLLSLVAGCPSPTNEPGVDDDGDGYSENDGDCDDEESTVFPGAEEVPMDGVDQDCSGADQLAFSQLAAGTLATCGRLTNSELACWPFEGELGGILPPDGIISQVDLGFFHGCVLKQDTGIVRCWGYPEGSSGDWGQVSQTPEDLVAVDVAAGWHHSCAVAAEDGRLHCWPEDPIEDDHHTFEAPGGAFVDVSIDETDAACAVRENGEAVCWGNLGDDISVEVAAERWRVLAPGVWTTCGITLDGRTVCVGEDAEGMVSEVPEEALTTISVGREHACGLTAAGEIRCWGEDDDDPWGYSNDEDDFGQVTSAPEDGTFVEVVSAENYSCALTKQRTVTCWGDRLSSQPE